MIKLWYAVVDSSNQKYEDQVYPQLSNSELNRLGSIKNELKKHEYLLSRALMRHALSHQFKRPSSEWQFIEQSNLAPKINNLPENCHFSLSHSHGKICLAISNEPVGIDIEQKKMRSNFSSLANAFMNQKEAQLLNESKSRGADIFYKIWCAKEASYKITPTGLQRKLFLKQIDYFALTKGTHDQNLSQGSIEKCHLALVTHSQSENIKQQLAHTFKGAVQIQWF
jgi:4'-phosphopantetheinyl transferase